MPSASINNQSSTKLVKQTSVNSVNSGGASGTSIGKANKKVVESSTKSNNTNTTVINHNEVSSLKTAKENTNNVVAAAQQQNNKNWETSSVAGNNTSVTSAANKDAGNDALNPMKLTFTTIEHKIRNLEKRKTKLEGYLDSGKELNSEQRAAVAKYDAVMATLEFARDLVKQMQQFTKDAEKEQKKQVRKDLIAKAQAETVKIREVLIMQNILSCLTDDAVRNDFSSGENGAAKLEPTEMEILEKFCLDVQTRRPETSEDVPFATSAQKAAEIFSMTIDARPKQYGDTTYENVKRVFHRIQESDYLDKIYLTDVPEPGIKTVDEVEHEANNDVEDTPVAEVNNQEQEIVDESLEKSNLEAPTTHETTPVENNVATMDQQQQQQHVIMKEHLELQQQVTLTTLPPQTAQTIIPTPMAPPATAVPSFQPTVPAPHSGATTPVHVAIYHPSLQQPAPQHLQQITNNAALIGGVHTHTAAQILPTLTAQQLQQVGVQNLPPTTTVQSNQTQQQQQRQMLTSPAPGQPGVGAGPIAIHNANPQQQPLPPGHFNPTPVHAVEQNFFKHQSQHPHQPPPQPQQQYLQQMRPLAEVIGSGNFYFLQDSELDSPDLNNQGVQGVPQNTIVFEQQQPQQQPHQNLQQNKPTQHVITEQSVSTQNQQQQQQQQQQQLQQLNQQHPLNQPQNSTPTPIQTQTFTNQSFPQMPPPQQQQQQQQPQQHPSNTGLMQSNTPSPLFQQPPPQQQQKVTNNQQQQIYSPVQNQNMITPHQQQSQLIMTAANETPQQPPPNIMILNRLAAAATPTAPLMQQQQQGLLQQQQQQITPQSQNLVTGMQQQLPPNPAAADISQTPKNAGFPFENAVVSGLGYEQQMQNKLNAEKVLNAFQEANNIAATHLHKNDLINEWDEAVLKSNSSPSANSQQDYNNPSASVQAVETTSNKWSAEVNANSPITIQQNSSRKNEWTSSATNANNGVTTESSGGAYVSDNNRPESNHWQSQDSHNYGRGSSGGNRGQGSGAGGYQRQRNDDRRDDRRPGGGYRGRSNYGSGNPQQNGQSRGGGGGNSSGIYFRNNENSNNSYYQNGNGGGGGGGGGSNVYSNKDSRYDSRGGGNYRGPRGSDNSTNPRNNGPPPRHMGNRTSGGNINNTNSNSYMNSRQSNRMPLGIENKN